MRIFFSYRRGPAEESVGRIQAALRARWGDQAVFDDLEKLHLNARGRWGRKRTLQACLVFIDPDWLRTGDLHSAEDPVHIAVLAALQHCRPVISILLGGASLPSPLSLPEALRPLLLRPALTLSTTLRSDEQMQRLIRLLETGGAEEGAAPTPMWRARLREFAAVVVVLMLGLLPVFMPRRDQSSQRLLGSHRPLRPKLGVLPDLREGELRSAPFAAFPRAENADTEVADAALREKDIVVHAQATTIRSGRFEVWGSLEPNVIRRVVQSHIGEVRFCFEAEQRTHPGVTGLLLVRFLISPSGQVTGLVIKSSTLDAARVEHCIDQVMRRWTFPAPEGGGNVTVEYPFLLE